jgi:large subunit ribosomal protein L23
MGILNNIFSKKTEDKNKKAATDKKVEPKKELVKKVEAPKSTTLKVKEDVGKIEADKEVKSKKVKKEDSKLAFEVLIKPLITEKVTNLVSLNKYAFKVSNNANKVKIKRAIKALYGFEPLSVNIINERGKRVTYGRIKGKKSNWKKAIITLKAGDKLEIYEGV